MIVMKFGGSSVNDAASIDRVIKIIQEHLPLHPVIVVSAMGKTTRNLLGAGALASRLGAMQEIVTDMETGLHFTPGNPEELAGKVAWAWDHPGQLKDMGRAARLEYEQKYKADDNYAALMSIYHQAIFASR